MSRTSACALQRRCRLTEILICPRGFRGSGLPAAIGLVCESAPGDAPPTGGGKLCAWIRRNKTMEYFRRQALARAQPTARRGIAWFGRLY